jgi:hypothetical protein
VISLSPGLVQAGVELLGLAARNVLTFIEIRASFAVIGGMDCDKVIDFVQTLNWLRSNGSNIAEITSSGNHLLQ